MSSACPNSDLTFIGSIAGEESLGLRESQAVLQSPPAFLTLHLKAVSCEAFTPFQFQYALKAEHHCTGERLVA